MKNVIIGFVAAIMLITLASGTLVSNEFFTVKPAKPSSVVILVDDNLWTVRTKASNYIKKGYIIKETTGFHNANSPYYKVMMILEKY